MKTIKIILGIISVFVVVFLLTGILIKETSYTAQVSIDKSVSEVFKTFNNSQNIKNWIPEVKSFETINNPICNTIISIYKVVIENKGQEIVMTEQVIAYVPNEKVTLFFNAENMLKIDDYVFSEKAGFTTITLNSSCQSETYLMGCMFPYFKGTFQEQDQMYLNNFKKYIGQQ